MSDRLHARLRLSRPSTAACSQAGLSAPHARQRASTSSQITCSTVSCTSCTRAVVGCRHVHVHVGHRGQRPPSRARQRDRRRARRACAVARRLHHVGRRAARRDAQQHVARTAQAPRPAGRTPARTRSRCRSPSARSCPSSAPAPARRAPLALEAPDSSAAKCWASAALPPLPQTSTLPPGRERRPASARRPRSCPRRCGAARRVVPAAVSSKRLRGTARATAIGRLHLEPGRCVRGAARCRSMLRTNSSSVTCSGSPMSTGTFDLHRVVLAQRVAFPVVGHQDAPQVGMPLEHDAEQVEHLALVPVRRSGRRVDDASAPRARRRRPRTLHAEARAGGTPAPRASGAHRHEVVDHLEARLDAASSRRASARRATWNCSAGCVAQRARDARRWARRGTTMARLVDGAGSGIEGHATATAGAMPRVGVQACGSRPSMDESAPAHQRLAALLRDLPLQLHDAVDERLGTRRAARARTRRPARPGRRPARCA